MSTAYLGFLDALAFEEGILYPAVLPNPLPQILTPPLPPPHCGILYIYIADWEYLILGGEGGFNTRGRGLSVQLLLILSLV